MLVRSPRPRSKDPIPPIDEDPADELVCGDSTDVPPRGEVTLLVDCDDECELEPLGGDITLVGGVTEE